jgi:Flp pilus assembly protein TadG
MAQRIRRFRLAISGRRLARDERGVSIVEFGLFFPILALMLLGTIDFGRGLATKFKLDQATQRTIELASLAGRAQADYSFLVPEAVNASGVPTSQVRLGQWLECRTASGATRREASFSGTCQTGEQTARYITITIWDDYVPMFASIPIIGQLGTGPGGSIRITSDSGVRVQ